MYSFEPSEEQRMLIDAVERYAANDLREAARDAEESGEIPRALIEKGWEMGEPDWVIEFDPFDVSI